MKRTMIAMMLACAPESVTRWEAAHLIAESYCAREQPEFADCVTEVVSGWCSDAADCAERVEDIDLLDDCIERLDGECWSLFRDGRP